MKATTAIILDTRYKKESGTYPVKLRVTFRRRQKYYPTDKELTRGDWDKMKSPKPGKLKDTSLELNSIEAKAKKIIDKLPVFSFEQFKNKFLNVYDNTTISGAFAAYRKALDIENTERTGTDYSYNNALQSLEKFKPGSSLLDVTTEYLRKYERWMKERGNSETTIGIYLRALRAVFNKAIADGDIPAEFYPFGKHKYEIPQGSNVKKALTLQEIGLIYHYKAKGTTAMARDYWLFMYLCNGFNPKDMVELKYKNIHGDFIMFQRAKSIRTKRVKQNILVSLQQDAKNTIEKYGTNGGPEDYIFPVLENGLTAKRKKDLKDNFIRLINDHMKIIADDLKIKIPVKCSTARHSFATILKRSGATIEFISDALGHGDVKVTENYLAGFEDETIKKTAEALVAFKNKKVKKPAKVVVI